ncbi:MAG: S1 RNA-binding domain-containing protein, partial [Candidatus Manganitrophaceae bacterium]
MSKGKRAFYETDEAVDAEKSQERMELESLYAETFKNLQEGSVVEGTILSIQEDGVMVDIGYKSEGMVSKQEFTAEEIGKLKPGEKILI